jgi:hypothetical protein
MATPTGSIRLVLCLLGPSGLLLRLVLLVGSGSVYGMGKAYGMGSRQAGRRLAGWARRARATDGARHGQLSADLEAGCCTSTSTSTGGPISRTAACSVCSACSVLPFLSSPCFLPAHGFRSAAACWPLGHGWSSYRLLSGLLLGHGFGMGLSGGLRPPGATVRTRRPRRVTRPPILRPLSVEKLAQ